MLFGEHKIEGEELTLPPADAEKLLRDMSASFAKRFKQELAGENEDLLDRALRKYRAKVVRRSWHVAQKWCNWSQEGPVLTPDHTRLYYRKGKTEILVQEHSPQIRLMRFYNSLIARSSSNMKIPDGDTSRIYSYSLALPYMVFLFKFVDGVFEDVWLAFNDRPMRHMQERPLVPYLSNIDPSLKVCLGHVFQNEERQSLEAGNLVQQIALVYSNFWSTIYSDEWSQSYWNYRNHFVEDNRLSSMAAWQEASSNNPLFVVEDVPWIPHSEENFGDIMVRLLQGEPADNTFQQELYNDLADNFLDEVKKILEENIQRAEQKLATMEIAPFVNDLLSKVNAKT